MKKGKKVKNHLSEVKEQFNDEIFDFNIESLTEVQGGIDEKENIDYPAGSCGLGCFQGSGGLEEPTKEN